MSPVAADLVTSPRYSWRHCVMRVCEFMQTVKFTRRWKRRLKLTCLYLGLCARDLLTTVRRQVARVRKVWFFQVHALGGSIWVELIETCTNVNFALWFGASCFTSLKNKIKQYRMRQLLRASGERNTRTLLKHLQSTCTKLRSVFLTLSGFVFICSFLFLKPSAIFYSRWSSSSVWPQLSVKKRNLLCIPQLPQTVHFYC